MTRALADFRLEPGVYRLGQFSPVSIRDQVVRANYLVEHLAASGELAVSTRLLIIGAGAAGVMAAIAGERLGVQRILLVERAGTVMPLQARSKSRWLDPVQYDWPATHWADHKWPVSEAATGPRRFSAVSAPLPALSAAISEDWAIAFQNRAARVIGRAVGVLYYTEAGMWSPASPGFAVPLLDLKSNTTTPVGADVIIFSAGFGIEHSAVPDVSNPGTEFWGLNFWADDKFELDDMGIPVLQHGVLVSGGGDGALQDFVRLTTGVRSVGDIMEVVWKTTNSLTDWKRQLLGLWHWEDHAGRSRGFAPHPLDECELLRRLHLRHADAIQALTASPQWASVFSWLDKSVSKRSLGTVFLALKCDHFHWCYGLNRSVALILLEYLKQRGISVLKTNVALKGTRHKGASPACTRGCWGHTHEAHLSQRVSCATDEAAIKAWPAADTATELYDGLVIRHGIDPLLFSPRIFDKLKPQIAPFHLP